jgi:hypothetical protein
VPPSGRRQPSERSDATESPFITARGRIAVLAGCVLVAVLVALYAAAQARTGPPVPPAGSVRLGPDAGEDVAAYAGRARASLPPPGTATLALVQFAESRTVPDAAAVGATPVEAVFRVAIPRVQTALRFEPLTPGTAAGSALDVARQRAALAAGADAARLGRPAGPTLPAGGTGTPQPGAPGAPRGGASGGSPARAAAVAAAEAAVLEQPGCRCVVALVVSADGAALRALAAAPGVRAVEAAPAGAALRELALSPLLPEQVLRADPPPDDGPVP